MRSVLLLTTLACSVYGDSNVQGPSAGYIASSTGVRRILGLIGAAQLGVPAATDLQRTVVLPGAEVAIGVSASGDLIRVNLTDGAIASLDIKDITEVVSSPSGQVVLAIAGEKAYLLSKTGSRLATLTLPASPVRAAVADQGSTIAIATEGGSLYVVNEMGARDIFHSASLPALAFLPNSTDLAVADESGGLYRINADLQLTKVATVAGTRALAGQRQRLLAVTEHAISAVDLGTGETTATDCSCAAIFAKPVGESSFLLSDPDDGPIWVLDAAAGQLRVAFIPEAVNE